MSRQKDSSNRKLVSGNEPHVFRDRGTKDGMYLLKEGSSYNLYHQERGVQVFEKSFGTANAAMDYLKL